MARDLLRQALLGLDLLHSNGLAHGDFQPGNLLFSLRGLDKVPEVELRQHSVKGSVSKPVRRRDGKKDLWAPRYLALDQSLDAYADVGPGFEVKLSDFGEVFNASKPEKRPSVPMGLRAPELVLGLTFDEKIDIWSFGCLAFEFLTGMAFFGAGGFPNEQKEDDELLLQMTDALGPLPDSIFTQWPRANLYFGPNRERIQWSPSEGSDHGSDGLSDFDEAEPSDLEDDLDGSDWEMNSVGPEPFKDGEENVQGNGNGPPGTLGDDIKDGPRDNDDGNNDNDHDVEHKGDDDADQGHPPLEKRFKHFRPKELSDSDAEQLLSLIRTALQYERTERPSAATLLKHPFFSETQTTK
ncbi:MAG: hypothetical protein M4579_002935 [Chaenotheca gracillima]|nr:MAG: hypothetical protein M4579_002935 [Chaenotheca gracillima]